MRYFHTTFLLYEQEPCCFLLDDHISTFPSFGLFISLVKTVVLYLAYS